MNKKISLIIPVYNVEKYIERCIVSIVSQDVSVDDYELIIVNDGSTDKSRQIAGDLQKQYPVIKIIDKENGGLSSARNEGIEHASGEYLFFIDSDDWLAEGSLKFLVEWAGKYNIDIMLFGICETGDTEKRGFLVNHLSPDDQILNIDEYLTSYTLRSAAWQGLFRREIFIGNNIRFKYGFIAEDDDFVVRFFSKAKQIVCNSRTVYYYYYRAGSISKGKESEKKIIRDKLVMLGELDSYIRQFNGKLRLGLQRKLDFLAVDIIRLLIRKNHTSVFIGESLSDLKKTGYFPLKKASYTGRYNMFRIIFCNRYLVKFAKVFRKYI